MSANPAICQNCEAPLPPDVTGSVCPACLVGEVMDSLDTLPGEPDTALPAGSNSRQGVGSDSLEGTTLGIGDRYKILQRIGEGGFGMVYMAEQTAPVRRRVAIKILKAGMDTHQLLARFEAERQALAMMDHPNIARVLDGGETEQGRPFFVMDLVRGDPITKFCDEESLPPGERLQLFVKVCRAVQHAHQKGIIHRDLKPSNILVTVEDGAEPVPKVIDFGVAKAMESNLTDKTLFTRFEQMIGTPAYMSPEQAGTRAAQDVDTRADIYALGVLLYELLTGTTPFEARTLQSAAFDEVRRILREEEAPRPSARLSSMALERRSTIAKERGTEASALGKHLRGDLDWIVMKSIEKDRRRRYETANALALDVERHLGNQPVTAGSPTVGYRLSKFLLRNKTGVGVAAVVLLSLIGGLALAMVGFARAKLEAKNAGAAEEKAENESTIARAINEFLVDDIIGQAGSGESPEPDLTIKTALDRAAERAESRLGDQPLVLAEIHEVLRDAYGRMGFGEEAIAQAEHAYRLLVVELGEDARQTLYARYRVAHMLLSFGSQEDWQECLIHIEPTLKAQRILLGEQDPATLASIHTYLFAATAQRPNVDTIALARTYVANAETVYADNPEKNLEAHRTLAWILWRKDIGTHAREIEQILSEALDEGSRALGAEHPTPLRIKSTLAGFYEEGGSFVKAERLYRECIRSHELSDGSRSPKLIGLYNTLAIVLSQQGKSKDAEAAMEHAAELARTHSSERNPDQVAIVVGNHAYTLRTRGNLHKALQQLKDAHPRVLEGCTEEYSRHARRFLDLLARTHADLGQEEEAVATLAKPLAAIVRAEGLEKASEEVLFSTWAKSYLSLHAKDGFHFALQQQNDISPERIHDKALDGIFRSTLREASAFAGSRKARDGNWAAARDHYDNLLARSGDEDDFPDFLQILPIGAVLLRIEDHEKCRRRCDFFMGVYERTERAEPAAKIALLLPEQHRKPLLERSMAIVRTKTAPEYKENSMYPWYCLARGMGEYRSANLSDAAVWLEKAKGGWIDCKATAHAFQALVARAQGSIDSAVTELNAAELCAVDRSIQARPGGNWFDDVVADLALEEARRKILFTGTKLISPTATWSFLHLDDGADPATTDSAVHQRVAQVAFDVSSWQTGADGSGYDGGFGYGWPVSTEWALPEEGKRKSAYLRHCFSTTESHTDLLLHLRVDDGVIVYLDGKEAGRFNIAADEADRYGLTAERELSRFERANHRLLRLKGALPPGEHVLALSLHNASDTSPDLAVGSISLYGTPVE